MSRNAEYATPLSLWGTVVDRRPHGRARTALATELIAAGDHAAALPQLREAVRDFPDARYALGTELVIGGKIDDGIAELRQFIQARPQHPNRIPARTLLAQALGLQGKFAEAADELRPILTLAPDSESVHTLLADMPSGQASMTRPPRNTACSPPAAPAIRRSNPSSPRRCWPPAV